MSSDKPIRGKIARVLNSREVALNRGSSHGVAIGMLFDILSPKGSDILDPDTGAPLGSIDVVKTRVKITIVQDRVSVGSTYRTRRINVGGSGLGFGSWFEPPKWENQVETLRVDETSKEELDEADAFVHTGDPVVQVFQIVPD